jgi:hypothetical protein
MPKKQAIGLYRLPKRIAPPVRCELPCVPKASGAVTDRLSDRFADAADRLTYASTAYVPPQMV